MGSPSSLLKLVVNDAVRSNPEKKTLEGASKIDILSPENLISLLEIEEKQGYDI